MSFQFFFPQRGVYLNLVPANLIAFDQTKYKVIVKERDQNTTAMVFVVWRVWEKT